MDWNNTESTELQLPATKLETVTELFGDYSLPDYQPEIKRLLHIRPVMLPPVCYAGAGNAEVSGNIDYYVLYMGNDGRLYCAPLSAEYSVSLPTDGEALSADGEFDCHASCRAENVSGRVSAARRLSIRSRLHTTLQVHKKADLGKAATLTADADGEGREILTDECSVGEVIYGKSDLLHVSDSIIVEGRDKDARIVCAEGEVILSEVSAGNGCVNCRGDLLLRLLLGDEGERETYSVLQRKLPFSESVPMEGVGVSSQSCASGCCTELSVEMDEDGIHVDAGLLLTVCAQKNRTLHYPKDVYVIGRPTICTYETLALPHAEKCVCGNFTLSDSLSLVEAGIDPNAEILLVNGDAACKEMNRENGNCKLCGTAVFSLLLRAPDGEMSSAELTFPFRYETDGGNATDYTADMQVLSCRGKIDGERVGIDAEIGVCARLYSQTEITAPVDVTVAESVERTRGELILCYPAPTDSLWSVARRYCRPLQVLRDNNTLPPADAPDSPDSLTGVKYLLI